VIAIARVLLKKSKRSKSRSQALCSSLGCVYFPEPPWGSRGSGTRLLTACGTQRERLQRPLPWLNSVHSTITVQSGQSEYQMFRFTLRILCIKPLEFVNAPSNIVFGQGLCDQKITKDGFMQRCARWPSNGFESFAALANGKRMMKPNTLPACAGKTCVCRTVDYIGHSLDSALLSVNNYQKNC